MKTTKAFFTLSVITVWMSLMALPGVAISDPLDGSPAKMKISGKPRVQEAIAQLAQKGEESKRQRACFRESTVEKCSACCKSLLEACRAMVIPFCLDGEPNRSEFRHCHRGRLDRCNGDFENCGWLCRRVK
ncbi:MAG: hypothetical protein ACE5E9_02715 [Nitrospinaceae bacterium]